MIEHVVVLMLENRSFDSMLGWLYEHDQPLHNLPPAAAGDAFRGLAGVDPKAFRNHSDSPPLTAEPQRGASGFTVPTPAPGEEHQHVNVQFYDRRDPPPDATATMTGVLADYVNVMHELGYTDADVRARAGRVLESYTPAQLPVLNQLARHYAVSDHWFASVPTQTNANRAFALCGTSHGLVNNGELESDPRARVIEAKLGMHIGDDRFPDRTIFHALTDAGRDWRVFWQTSYLPEKVSWALDAAARSEVVRALLNAVISGLGNSVEYLRELTAGNLESSFTWRLFPEIAKLPDARQRFAPVADFHAMARAGTLPAFSYVEPFWTISQCGADDTIRRVFTSEGNDYHPPANLRVGEAFVKDVYESLIANRAAWEKTMLVITFDEFVGSFDHVAPPAAVAPWGDGTPPFHSPTGFDFRRLGARVPAIVVSPLVERATVFRPTAGAFDHTSMLATALGVLGAGDHVKEFGARTAAAPTFGDVLTRSQPRTDERDLPFLHRRRQLGDGVRYGDDFVLEHSSGALLSSAVLAPLAGPTVESERVLRVLADVNLAAFFPTLGSTAVTLTVLSEVPDADEIYDGEQFWLVSNEPALGARTVLGAWADAKQLYWSDLYLDGDHAEQERWALSVLGREGQPLRYGDTVTFANGYYQDQYLAQAITPQYLTTSRTAQRWRILPAGG